MAVSKSPFLSGLLQWAGIFVSVAFLSSAFAAYSALQTVSTASSWTVLSSSEWNKMVANFTSADSQLSSLSSSIAGLGSLAVKSAVESADITDGTIATADIANSAVTDAKVAAGIAPSKLAQASATSGQVLKWNGSAWAPAADSTGTAGGITAITTASCSTSSSDTFETSCSANCPSGYFRTGCSAGRNGRNSGFPSNGCTFASYLSEAHYTLCAK